MTQDTAAGRSVTSQVEVRTDPATAFKAFTEELDLWWVRGPINHWAAGRMRALRCELGVGGRVLEVYNEDPEDALELARITDWQPGRRLAWNSSVDDVEIEITFQASGPATLVTVTATIPEGGVDRGGTSWTRTVPKWLARWIERRDDAPHAVNDLARLGVGIYYAQPAAAARWLAAAFGFDSPDPLPADPDPLPEGDHGHPWIEFRIGNGSLMIFKQTEPSDGRAHETWVYVDRIEEHFARAKQGGAVILQELDAPWGLPMYVAEDLEGHRWTFAQARPTM